MNWFQKIIEHIRGNEDFSDIKSSTLRDVINGNIFTKKFFRKQYLFLLLLTVLAFFYVDNRFYSERQLLRMIDLKKKVKDVKYESLTLSTSLMELSRQSSIAKMIKERNLDLNIPATPPMIITDKAEVKNN